MSVRAACENGSLETLKMLITEGHAVDVRDNLGWRTLHVAAAHGHLKCLKYLLKHPDVDVNWLSFEDQSPLMLSCLKGFIECVDCLLQNGADPNQCNNLMESPVMKAVQAGHVGCVQLLLEHGADPNRGQYNGCTPLHAAVYSGNTAIVNLLLKHGADIRLTEECNITPVFVAAQFGQTHCLELLLEEARRRDMEYLADTSADDGATPLYLAAQNGHEECVNLLLKHKANPNRMTQSPQAVAVCAAVQFGRLECVKLLLPRTDVQTLKACDGSPFQLAASDDSGLMLQYLIDNLKDYNIDTPQILDFSDYNYKLFCCIDIEKMFKSYVTPLTTMLYECSSPENIEIMLKAGASPNPDGTFILPPILVCSEYGGTKALTSLLQHGADPNIYYPGIHFNLSILFALLNVKQLGVLLRHGAETTSCFHRTNCGVFESTSNENKEKYLHASGLGVFPNFKEVLLRYLGSHITNFSHVAKFKNLLKLLLEFTTIPGPITEVLDVLSSENRKEIETILSTPSSLMQFCRVKIRQCLTYRNLNSAAVQGMHLPALLNEYILYENSFDSVSPLVDAVCGSSA